MNTLLRIEELFLTLLAFVLFLPLGYGWWWFPILFFAPDLGMLGYLVNPTVGAWGYNLIHHKGVALTLYILGGYFHFPGLQLAGLILFAHSSLDRVLGYGLKYPDSFQHTHLGMIGRTSSPRLKVK